MKVIGFILLVLIFLVALALGAQNQQVINFNYLIAQGEFGLSLLLGGAFAFGFVFGAIVTGLLYVKTRMSAALLKKQVARQREELSRIRLEPAREQ